MPAKKDEKKQGNRDVFLRINQVEGYDPFDFARVTVDEGTGRESYSLDIDHRRTWFRLKHPEGTIQHEIIEHTEQMAIIKVTLTDANGKVIGSGVAQNFATADEEYGKSFFGRALTYAEGVALRSAGFDLHGVPVENTISPIEPSQNEEPEKQADDNGSAQQEEQKTAPAKATAKAEPKTYEEVYATLTLDEAMACVVSCNGTYKGKTLGEIVHSAGTVTKAKGEIAWYANEYTGKDTKLKASAAFLINEIDRRKEEKKAADSDAAA